MTTDRDFDRIARAWLDLMPDEVPDRTLAAVLDAVDATPQVRQPWRRLPWRARIMERVPILVGAAAVAVIGAAIVVSTSQPAPGVGTTPSASVSSSPSATSSPGASPAAVAPVPTALRNVWMGGHRDPVATDAGSALVFEEDVVRLEQAAGSTSTYLQSTATPMGESRLQVQLDADGNGCAAGDVGTYDWSLNLSGRVLTFTADEDDCAARAAAFAGEWWLMGCTTPDDNCLGLLDAGTYATQFIGPRIELGGNWSPNFGAITYSVPEGWANASEWPESLELVPADELPPIDEADRRRSITVLTNPSAMTQDRPCSGTIDRSAGATIDELASWIGTVDGLITSEPTAITISGRPAVWLDVELEPSWDKACEGDPLPLVAYLNPGIAIAPGERERVFLVDLGQDDVIVLSIWARDQASFDAFVPEAMPVIESFQFE